MSKVLVVEDNDLNMKLFHDLLSIKHYDVIASRDGKGVLDIAKAQKPDLILMDIQLKELHGADLIAELKNDKETLHIPIIAITAFAMKQDETRIMQSGCDMYLPKPVSIGCFFEAVEHYIGK